jgi:predicted AlkP superfamily phosphohydrolase/phosphomutase
MRRTVMALLAAILPLACAGTGRGPVVARGTADSASGRRAIVLSIDAFNESRVTSTIDAARIPAIRRLFAEGECAAAIPAFPSVTAAGHAAIWTGAYGNESGIPANWHLLLPSSEFDITRTTNGFRSGGLRAEPLWIRVAAAGRRAYGHHVTQAPQPPGYPVDEGEPADTFAAKRQRAARALSGAALSVLNGYNRLLLSMQLVTETDTQRTAPGAWVHLATEWGEERLAYRLALDTTDAEMRPFTRGRALHLLLRLWPAADSGHLLASYDPGREPAVRVMPVPEETAPIRGRALARHFSAPAIFRLGDGRRASTRLRLFRLSPRDRSFALLVPGLQLAEANRPSLTAAYDSAAPGWVGNSAAWLWEEGRLGPTLEQAGDGTAERRLLESAELLTLGFMSGAAWGWETFRPQFMADYFPLGDDADHTLWGLLDARAPTHDAAVARRAVQLRERLWELVDVRLAALMQLTEQSPGTRLFVTGDHGMRAIWRWFHPNTALRDAGLLATDAWGRVDLSRTRAYSPNGYWINVNREGRRGGIVPADSVGEVIAAVRRALHAVRDEAGRAVVTQTFDAREVASRALGMGGAAGGEVYYEVAEGYAWTRDLASRVVVDAPRAEGEHGFPSTSADMHTVLCEWMPGIGAARPVAAPGVTDLAPAVRRWVGVP